MYAPQHCLGCHQYKISTSSGNVLHHKESRQPEITTRQELKMLIKTYRLSLLKISLFILLLSSYRLEAQRDRRSKNPSQGDKGADLASFHHHDGEIERRVPHVFLAVLARNVAHMLANFFGCVENLDYPKDSVTIW